MLSEESREKRRQAGRLGGRARVAKGFSKDRKLASEAGRKGAEITNAKKAKRLGQV